MAVGWLCVSTFIEDVHRLAVARYTPLAGIGEEAPAARPSITAALSLYAESTPAGLASVLRRIIWNSECGLRFGRRSRSRR